MNKALLIALALLCCASLAFAQPPGSVAVYGDDGYGNINPQTCKYLDGTGAGFATFTMHFVHVADNQDATAVEFQADMSQLNIIQDFGDASPWPLKIGAFRTGTSIAYGSCKGEVVGGIYLGSTTVKHPLTYRHLCAKVYVKNNPNPGVPGATTPLATDCTPAGNWVVLRGAYFVVSYDFTNCPCPGTIPTEESSWGQIKALYE